MKNMLIFFVLFSSAIFSQQNNWQQINSPGGGNVNRLFRVSDSILIAGMQGGSIYRSADCGMHWQEVHRTIARYGNTTFRSFCFNSYGHIFTCSFEEGILKSTDRGLTWTKTGTGESGWLSRTKSGILFSAPTVTGPLQIYRSTNEGETWQTIYLTQYSSLSIRFLTCFNDELIIVLDNTLYCSSDSGRSWIKYGTKIPSYPDINSILPINESRLFASNSKGIFLTTDRGMTWINKSSGLPSNIREISTYGNKLYAYSSAGIFCSTNNGDSWSACASNSYLGITSIIVSDSSFIASTFRGVYKTENNKWTNLSSGIFGCESDKILCADNGDLLYCTDIGNFRSTDKGNSWNCFTSETISFNCRPVDIRKNYYITQASDYSVYTSTDFGFTWRKGGALIGSSSGFVFSRSDTNIIYTAYYGYHPQSPPSCGISVSSNMGISWGNKVLPGFNRIIYLAALKEDILFSQFYDYNIHQYTGIHFTTGDNKWEELNTGLPNKVVTYLVSDRHDNLFAVFEGGIYLLDKKNITWVKYSSFDMTFVRQIIFNKYDQMIVVKDDGIFASHDGKNWNSCGPETQTGDFKSISVDSEGYYYASDRTGRIYKTITPHLITTLPTVPVNMYPANGHIACSDTLNLIWQAAEPLVLKYKVTISEDSLFSSSLDTLVTTNKFTFLHLIRDKKYYWKVKAYNETGEGSYSMASSFIAGTTSSSMNNSKSYSYQLNQNYPNPFNPVTHITYSIARPEHVMIRVFDLLGAEVMTLVNRFENAGEHKIEFNASSLPSGVYFYRITAGKYTNIKKMLLLR